MLGLLAGGLALSVGEWSAWVGVVVAVVTLLSKLVSLIASIQALISRIDRMADEIVEGKAMRESLAENLSFQARRLDLMKRMFDEIRQELGELKLSVKEVVQGVF